MLFCRPDIYHPTLSLLVHGSSLGSSKGSRLSATGRSYAFNRTKTPPLKTLQAYISFDPIVKDIGILFLSLYDALNEATSVSVHIALQWHNTSELVPTGMLYCNMPVSQYQHSVHALM
uniref:Uncharacterized protein n=1 Tax=Glossina austeni TaxID=7395 RepID=A0A1A9UZ66_GLOAU